MNINHSKSDSVLKNVIPGLTRNPVPYISTRLRNEKGLALVMVLVLSLIALTIISTLIFMVTQGTKVSGFYKRYSTSLNAGYGGAEIVTSLVNNRG